MRLTFANLRFDGDIRTKWDVLLRIVGDFSLCAHERVIYREVDFCLVEFAVALAEWFAIATDLGPDFIYTSLESDTEGLVRFTRLAPGEWCVSAADQEEAARASLTTAEIKHAAVAYIRELRANLKPRVDVLQYIVDPETRQLIQQVIER